MLHTANNPLPLPNLPQHLSLTSFRSKQSLDQTEADSVNETSLSDVSLADVVPPRVPVRPTPPLNPSNGVSGNSIDDVEVIEHCFVIIRRGVGVAAVSAGLASGGGGGEEENPYGHVLIFSDYPTRQ